MGYYTGTANDMTALRQALIDACTQPAEGWAWNGTTEMLSKGAAFLKLQVVSGYLTLLGRTSASAGDAPNVARIGTFVSTAITWPVTYEIFAFAAEVYLVINYSADLYQWCAFGLSTVQGMAGSGMWVAASLATAAPTSINMTQTAGAGASGYACPALFWQTTYIYAEVRNGWVHSDLDSQAWWMAQTVDGATVGVSAAAPLIGILPNTWNSEAVLLPIRAYKVRASSKISLVADLEHARYTRIDNYTPGQIVTIGSDRWKVFPWYRKNTASRNAGSSSGSSAHTGTLGWAIRYEGP